MIRIEMPDGSVVGATKETPNMNMNNRANDVALHAQALANIPTDSASPPRTRLQIATDLDAAEREVTAAQLAVAEASQKVRDLSRELKGFGVKKRAAKGTP